MYNLVIALILFLVTGLLTVTEMVPVFFGRLVLFFAVVSVSGLLYGYITDFHDFAEDADMDAARPEPYNHYLLTLSETALQLFGKVVSGIWHSAHPALFSIIKLAITHLGIARSRRKPRRNAQPHSTLLIAVVSVLLVYLAYRYFPSTMNYVTPRPVGPALRPVIVIALASILVYLSRKHPVIQQIGSDICTFLDQEPNVVTGRKPKPQRKQADSSRATESNKRPAHTKPTVTPTPVSSSRTPTSPQTGARINPAAGYPPSVQPNRYAEIQQREARYIHKEKVQAERAYYADPGQINSFRSARQFPLSGLTTGRGWNASRQNLTSPGYASTNIRIVPESRGRDLIAGHNTPLSTSVGESPPYALGYLMETPRQPAKRSGLAGSSNLSLASRSSLPELDSPTPTYDHSTQANTSVNMPSATVNDVSVALSPSEGTLATAKRTKKLINETRVKSNTLPMCAPKVVEEARVARGEDKQVAVLRRSQLKKKQKHQTASKKAMETEKANPPAIVRALATPERPGKLITEVRVKSNNSPMDAPKVVAQAQVSCGENKGAALLRRSQWKQKNKYRVASKKEVEKVNAPVVVRPNSPMDTNADWKEASSSDMDEDPIYMDMDSRRSSPIGSPMVCSPVISPSPAQVPSPMQLSPLI